MMNESSKRHSKLLSLIFTLKNRLSYKNYNTRLSCLSRGLGADHLTLEGGGVIWKKKMQALVGRKKLHAAQMK